MDWALNKIADRKRRFNFRRRFLMSLKIVKFFLVLADTASDIYYLLTAHFYNEILFYLSILSLCALPTIIYLYFLCYKFKSLSNKIIFLFFWIISGPVLCFCYPLLIVLENFLPVDYRDISSFASLEYFYEALPQLCIQVLNNNVSKSWRTPKIISFALSSISLTLGFFQLARSKFNLDYLSFLENIEKSTITNVKQKFQEKKELEINLEENLDKMQANENIITELSQGQIENQILNTDEILDDFIKNKFFEKFDINRLVFFANYDSILDSKYSEEDHEFVETCLMEEFNKNSLKLEKKEFFDRCCRPLGYYIVFKMILVLTILVFSIAYLAIANFRHEYMRYILIFLLGWNYKHSISNIQKLEKYLSIRYLSFIRIITITDFYNLVFLLYNFEPKICDPLKTEFFHFPYYWVIFIFIQIYNYQGSRDFASFHITGIALSFAYLVFPILRILILLFKPKRFFYYFYQI